MFIYLELWRAKPAWLGLSVTERSDYIAALGPQMESFLAESGIEIVAWGRNRPTTDRRIPYDYLGIYRVPSEAAIETLESAIAGSGWYQFFDQANASALEEPPPQLLHALTAL